jgi:hypothetical protein
MKESKERQVHILQPTRDLKCVKDHMMKSKQSNKDTIINEHPSSCPHSNGDDLHTMSTSKTKPQATDEIKQQEING